MPLMIAWKNGGWEQKLALQTPKSCCGAEGGEERALLRALHMAQVTYQGLQQEQTFCLLLPSQRLTQGRTVNPAPESEFVLPFIAAFPF